MAAISSNGHCILNMVTLLFTVIFVCGVLCQGEVCEIARVSDFHSNGFRCTIRQASDFVEIPVNAEALDLKFSAGHTVDVSQGVVPRMYNLVFLKLDVTHIVYMPANAFLNVPSLQELSLYHVSPENKDFHLTLHQDAFAQLRSLRALHLVDLGIQSLHSKIFRDLISLDNLDINMNLLESLPEGIFANLEKLNLLSLARNHIQDLQHVDFTGLVNLATLNLYSNNVQHLRNGNFDKLSSLSQLNLEENEMLSVDNGAFNGLDSLRNLYLEQNNLTEVSPAMLSGISNLLGLHLNDNHLRSIDPNAFTNVPSLQTLNLANNDLDYIPPDALDDLDDLQYLILSGNKLSKLDAGLLQHKPFLEELDLSNNLIRELDGDAFHGLYSLKFLLLSGNPVSSLPVSAFKDLEGLEELSLSSSSWHCDCALYWLNMWLDMKGLAEVSGLTTSVCSTPAELHGRLVSKVYAANTLDCAATTLPPTTTTPAPFVVTKIYVSTHAKDNPADNSSLTRGKEKDADAESGHLSNAAKAGIISGLIILAVLIIVLTAVFIYLRQKRYAFWSPSRDQDEEEKRMGLFYRARHKVPSVYRDPQTGRMENILDIQQEEAESRKAAKRQAKASKNVVPIKKVPLNAISEEDDASKTPDIEKNRGNGSNGMLGLDLHLDLDDTFEIDIDTPPRKSPMGKEGDRSRPKSQPIYLADMSSVMRDSGIGNSMAEISASPYESHLSSPNHEFDLVPISHIDDQPATTPTLHCAPFTNKGSPMLCHHDNNNVKNFANDNASKIHNPAEHIEMNCFQQQAKPHSIKSVDKNNGTNASAPHRHPKSSAPTSSRSTQGSDPDQRSLDSYQGASFNDSTQHYPSTQDLVYM